MGHGYLLVGQAEVDFLANRPTAKYLRAAALIVHRTKVSAVNDVSSALAPSKLEPKTDKEQKKEAKHSGRAL